MEDILEKSFVVYLLKNKVNSKCYIGVTTQQLKKRLRYHRNNSATYIGRAIKKYGWENFKVEILEECASPDELFKREIYWIKTLNTKVPNGYNLTDGGEGSPGTACSEELKLAKSLGSPKKRPVQCINTGEIFHSINAAAKHFNILSSGISLVCQGKNMHVGGLKFQYCDSPLSEEELLRTHLPARREAIRCVETNEIFESIADAARHFGINYSRVSTSCNGRCLNSAFKYHFEYMNEAKRAAAEIRRNSLHIKEVPVRCVETNEIFSSISEASRATGIPSANIGAVCRGDFKKTGGFSWEYLDAEKRAAAEIKRNETRLICKPVRCIETSLVYSSIGVASRETGISRNSIGYVCNEKLKTAGGCHWEFVKP